MNRSRAAIRWGRSNASSVKPVSAPSASATILTGRLMLTTDIAAWMASSIVSRLRWMSFRLPMPYTTVDSPIAMYGATGWRLRFPSLLLPFVCAMVVDLLPGFDVVIIMSECNASSPSRAPSGLSPEDHLSLPGGLSKRVLRRELDQPWRTRSACDPAEGRAALDVGERRDVEVRMVPDVEELRGELEILLLGQAEILPNGKIPVLQERPT